MFMFYEVALIPMYLLIGVWGSGNKNYSAMKLTLMLMGGSTFLMLGLIGIYYQGGHTWNLLQLAAADAIAPEWQRFLFPMTFVGFGVLGAMFPFHTWSPDGHASAPHSSVDAPRRCSHEARRLRLLPRCHLPHASGCQ